MPASEEPSAEARAPAQCKRHEVCGRDEHEIGVGYCILHDPDEEKDQAAFDTAFAEHRDMLRARRDQAKRKEGEDYRPRLALQDDFRGIVFPGAVSFFKVTFPDEGVSFAGATFRETADFRQATFSDTANFSGATFRDTPDFRQATFRDRANFRRATFRNTASFNEATFSNSANFDGAIFRDTADFRRATFRDTATFWRATFRETTRFEQTRFERKASFNQAHFEGRALFKGTHDRPLFSREDKNAATVDFTNAEFHVRPNVRFLDVDLSRASFLHVDVREIEFTSVKWPTIDGGNGVYDEEKHRADSEALPHGALARLYRRLKQAYEDQRDYGRGGDFHFREKEMMRLDPNTSGRTKVILTLYRALSGYGERYWAAGWFLGLVAACSVLSIIAGLDYTALEGLKWTLRWRLDDFFRSLVYSVQAAFVRPPDYMTPSNLWGEAVKVATMILGPLLIGLFALAIRQRVRR